MTVLFGFSYDALSRRTALTRPNGVNTSYSYDSLSRLLSVLHKAGTVTLDGAGYAYDNAGNRTSKTNYLNNVTVTHPVAHKSSQKRYICVTIHMHKVSYLMEAALEARLYREFFRALANQTRFSIVQLLRRRPHYVNEMVEKLGVEQSRISHNLACLLNCGFVEWEWNGKNKVYRLNSDLQPILSGIEKHLVKYAPALDSCKTLESESKPVVLIAKSRELRPRDGGAGRKRK